MHRYIHPHRRFPLPLSERRLLFQGPDIPKYYTTPEVKDRLLKSDRHWEHVELLKKNPDYKNLVQTLDGFGERPEYDFLKGREGAFHKSMITAIIVAEAELPLPDATSVLGNIEGFLQKRPLGNYRGVQKEAFIETLGEEEEIVRSSAQRLGLDEGKINTEWAAIQTERPIDPSWSDEKKAEEKLKALKDAVFRVWLESWMGDWEGRKDGKTTLPLETAFRTADRLSNDKARHAGSLEITLLRYRKVLSEIYDALGKQGKAVFHSRIPEPDQQRLILQAWYGGVGELAYAIEILGGNELGAERVASILSAFRAYHSLEDRELLTTPRVPVDPPPPEWNSQPVRASRYLDQLFRHPKFRASSIPEELKRMVDGVAHDDTVSSTPAYEAFLSLVAGTYPPESGYLPGRLKVAPRIQIIAESAESAVGAIERYLGLDAQALGHLHASYLAYIRGDVPVYAGAGSWPGNYAAALAFLEKFESTAAPGGTPVRIKGKFMEELRKVVGKEGGNEAMVRNGLTALARYLTDYEDIERRSSGDRQRLSALDSMGKFVKEGWRDFQKLLNKNPVAGIILGVVLFKAAKYALFSKENYAKWIRGLVGGGVVGLYAIERYNPFGAKEMLENAVRGDQFRGTDERLFANILVAQGDVEREEGRKVKEGERLIRDNDILGHRALARLRDASVGELLDFYDAVRKAQISGEDAGSVSPPGDLAALRSEVTYGKRLSPTELNLLYFHILESIFARYSAVHEGPSGGGDAIADGRRRIQLDIVQLGLLVKVMEDSRREVLYRYAYLAKRMGEGVPEELARKEVAEKTLEEMKTDVKKATGPLPPEREKEVLVLFSRWIEPAGLKVEAEKEVKEAEDRVKEVSAGDGRQTKFSYVMNMIVRPEDLARLEQEVHTGVARYFSATGRGTGLYDRFRRHPWTLATGDYLGDSWDVAKEGAKTAKRGAEWMWDGTKWTGEKIADAAQEAARKAGELLKDFPGATAKIIEQAPGFLLNVYDATGSAIGQFYWDAKEGFWRSYWRAGGVPADKVAAFRDWGVEIAKSGISTSYDATTGEVILGIDRWYRDASSPLFPFRKSLDAFLSAVPETSVKEWRDQAFLQHKAAMQVALSSSGGRDLTGFDITRDGDAGVKFGIPLEPVSQSSVDDVLRHTPQAVLDKYARWIDDRNARKAAALGQPDALKY